MPRSGKQSASDRGEAVGMWFGMERKLVPEAEGQFVP